MKCEFKEEIEICTILTTIYENPVFGYSFWFNYTVMAERDGKLKSTS